MDRNLAAKITQLEGEVEAAIDASEVLLFLSLLLQRGALGPSTLSAVYITIRAEAQDSQPENRCGLNPQKAQHPHPTLIQSLHLVPEDLPIHRYSHLVNGGERVQNVHFAVHDEGTERPTQLLVDEDAVVRVDGGCDYGLS